MTARALHSGRRGDSSRGFSLIELMVTTAILSVVILLVTVVLLSSSRAQSRTVRRAEVQSSSRQALSLMTTELRQAGADPGNPPIGIVAIVSGDAKGIRVRSDLNGDRAIQTNEPSEDVTYSYNDTTRIVSRNPGSGAAAILSNVTALQFTYYDDANQVLPVPLSSANAARVTAIGLSLTTEKRDSRPITLNTRITLRNR